MCFSFYPSALSPFFPTKGTTRTIRNLFCVKSFSVFFAVPFLRSFTGIYTAMVKMQDAVDGFLLHINEKEKTLDLFIERIITNCRGRRKQKINI